MSTYSQIPVRLQADIISSPPVGPIDANTGFAPAFWRAQSVGIAVGIFDVNGVAVDLSNLAYLQIQFMETPSSPNLVLSKQVLAGSIIPIISRAGWLAGTAQQATFVISAAELDFSLNGQDSLPYWLNLSGVTSGGAQVVYAAGYITVFNPGSVLPPPSNGVVSASSQATASGDFTVTPGAQVHHEEITVSGAGGTRNCIVGAAGLEAGALVALRFRLPATAGIVIQVRNQTLGGTLLTTITTDASGFTPTARTQLWFDGVNFQRDFETIPANGQST